MTKYIEPSTSVETHAADATLSGINFTAPLADVTLDL